MKIEELWENTNNSALCQNNQKLLVENNLRCRKLTHSSVPEMFEGLRMPSRDLAHGDRAIKKTDQTLAELSIRGWKGRENIINTIKR